MQTIPGARWFYATFDPKPEPLKISRGPKYSRSQKRELKFICETRRKLISSRHLARRMGTSIAKVRRETEGLPFRFDFGRDRWGRLITWYYQTDLRAWAVTRVLAEQERLEAIGH